MIIAAVALLLALTVTCAAFAYDGSCPEAMTAEIQAEVVEMLRNWLQ